MTPRHFGATPNGREGNCNAFPSSFTGRSTLEHLTTITRSFDASHRVPDSPLCSRIHGHRFDVRITVIGYYRPEKGISYAADELVADLDLVLAELDRRDLNEMMPGTLPTPDGIALWLLERLVGRHPKIIELGVSDFAHAWTTVRRTPR